MSTPNPARLLAALESLEEEEKALVTELSSLQMRQRQVEVRLAELRDAIGPVKKLINGKPSFALVEPQESGLTGVPISEAIEKLLFSVQKPLTAPEIAKELLARGYQTSSENFTNLVGVTVRRLEKKKFVRDEQNRWSIYL